MGTDTWRYISPNDGTTRGHLIASNIFRTFFKTEAERNNPNPVFDVATYMTNVFPQYRNKKSVTGNEYFWSEWNDEEEREMEAAKHCLRNPTNNFFIAHGTVPGKDNMGRTTINIPDIMFMVYCCSEKFEKVTLRDQGITGKKEIDVWNRHLLIFKQQNEGFKPDKTIFKEKSNSDVKDVIKKLMVALTYSH